MEEKDFLEDPFPNKKEKTNANKQPEHPVEKSNNSNPHFLAIALLQATLTVGIFVFTYFLPDMMWNVSFGDLIAIASDKDLEQFTKLFQSLNITKSNSRSWALQRIFITIAIGIALLVIVTIIFNRIKDKKAKG